VPLVKIWESKGSRHYVVELPDRSHVRIPLSWADDGQAPLEEHHDSEALLSVETTRDLAAAIARIQRRATKDEGGIGSIDLSPKEAMDGRAAPAVQRKRGEIRLRNKVARVTG
jgi:hypothetical protein